MTKWTVRISSRLYLAVVLPPNTELTRTFSNFHFCNKTFTLTLPVTDWLTEWVTDMGKHQYKILRTCQFPSAPWTFKTFLWTESYKDWRIYWYLFIIMELSCLQLLPSATFNFVFSVSGRNRFNNILQPQSDIKFYFEIFLLDQSWGPFQKYYSTEN